MIKWTMNVVIIILLLQVRIGIKVFVVVVLKVLKLFNTTIIQISSKTQSVPPGKNDPWFTYSTNFTSNNYWSNFFF